MDHSFPIHTELVECQDCYKCVRVCSAKAIRVQDGHASIIPELCTACGHCVVVCPAKAKKIRNDLPRLNYLLSKSKKVYASLAPSWITNFPGVNEFQIVSAIKQLGFSGVSETALGAEEVSSATAAFLSDADPGLYISSACPSAVEYISRHMVNLRNNICNIVSPMLAHALLLKKEFGNDTDIVFFGPCIAKKLEADRNPDKINLALTFSDLNQLFTKAGIQLNSISRDTNKFIPAKAEEGTLYPVDGGMITTLGNNITSSSVESIAVSGTDNIQRLLSGYDNYSTDKKVFLEALSCPGGCVNGPCKINSRSGLDDILKVRNSFKKTMGTKKRTSLPLIKSVPFSITGYSKNYSNDVIKKALEKIGKHAPDDELNCGGCGYDSCRIFAAAMLDGKAETSMCVSLMRKKALNKANAILRCMPSAVVIADKSLKIIECNRRFAEMFGEDTIRLYEVLPSLKGAFLDKIIPFADLFKTSLRTGKDILRRNIRTNDKLLHVTVFTIEPSQVVGGIIQDASEIEMKREEIASKANDVLRKNLNTVQGIAKLLGENMADTEILLRSIAKGFKSSTESEFTSKDD